LRFLIYIVVLFVIGVCVFLFIQIRAESRAKSFCNSIKVGSKSDGLLEAAVASGARVPKHGWLDKPNSSQGLMTAFTGINPMYGYICNIDASNGIVVSKEFYVLDP
jgi:hypothetical protein